MIRSFDSIFPSLHAHAYSTTSYHVVYVFPIPLILLCSTDTFRGIGPRNRLGQKFHWTGLVSSEALYCTDHCARKPTANGDDDDSGGCGGGGGSGGPVAAAVKRQRRCREIKLSRRR